VTSGFLELKLQGILAYSAGRASGNCELKFARLAAAPVYRKALIPTDSNKRLRRPRKGIEFMATENGLARIGKTVVIRGELKGSEDLIVDGQLEGTINLTEGRLTIGPTANVAADL